MSEATEPAKTEKERIELRAPEAVAQKLADKAQELGMSKNALGVLSLDRGIDQVVESLQPKKAA